MYGILGAAFGALISILAEVGVLPQWIIKWLVSACLLTVGMMFAKVRIDDTLRERRRKRRSAIERELDLAVQQERSKWVATIAQQQDELATIRREHEQAADSFLQQEAALANKKVELDRREDELNKTAADLEALASRYQTLNCFHPLECKRRVAKELVATARELLLELDPHLAGSRLEERLHPNVREFKRCMEALEPLGFSRSPWIISKSGGEHLRAWMLEMEQWLTDFAKPKPAPPELGQFRLTIKEANTVFTIVDEYLAIAQIINQRKDFTDYEKLSYFAVLHGIFKEWFPQPVWDDRHKGGRR